jgi:hypothetical protein
MAVAAPPLAVADGVVLVARFMNVIARSQSDEAIQIPFFYTGLLRPQ